MACFVDSLFTICMNFVVKHINLVDSFVGFPALVGEKIFEKFALEYSINYNSFQDVLKKFVEAYENMVLDRLSLSKRLLILNEHFDTITIITRYVTELCVCNCFLGENHEIFSHISEFQSLKKLCLKDNSMNNSSMRLLTLRIRMYGIGGKEIESLDIAGNHFTDAMIPWLIAFPKLNFLNLSGSKISNKGIEALATQHNLCRVLDHKQQDDIVNKGWAVIIFEKWIKEYIKKKERKEKKLFFKKNISAIVKSTPSESSDIPLVFQKMPFMNFTTPPIKKVKLSVICDKDIEKDIYSQYM